MEDSLTRKQRRAIPLILAEESIETGCRSAGIARQTFYKWLPPLLRHVCRDVLDHALKTKETTEAEARLDVPERTVAQRAGGK